MVKFVYHGSQTAYPEMYKQIWDQNGGVVAVDLETVSLKNREPLGIGFAPNEHDAFYFPIDSPLLPWHILDDPRIIKLFHNGSFDLGVLKSYFDMDLTSVWDSIIAAQLQGYPPALSDLAGLMFGDKLMTIEDLIGKKGKNQGLMSDVPLEKVANKCCQDVKYTQKVWNKLQPNVEWPVFGLEMELLPILVRMEDIGLRIDIDRLLQHRDKVKKDVEFYYGIAKGMGFNPGSSMQTAAVLESRGWKIRYNRTTGKPILNEEILSTVYRDDPISHLVLAYRKSRVILSTFINAIFDKHLDGDRIYPRVNQAVVASGRLSRTQPNTQNIPVHMRDIFIPSKGNYYEDWDLSQIELRVLAYLVWIYTGDYTMQQVFDSGGDVHNATSMFIFGDIEPWHRRISKDINFAVCYRGTAQTLYQRSGVPVAQGQKFMDQYFANYPGINQFFDIIIQGLYANGYTSTMLGRKRFFPELQYLDKWGQLRIEREAFNHVIQGTASEVMKKLLIRNAWASQCNTVHDSITFDLVPGQVLDRNTALDLAPYRTPMEVKWGMNWRDLEKLGIWG
tara:strand:- start:5393 stop:7075 length:1683 start_codon:yes stop_codon:yes gene_type:complete